MLEKVRKYMYLSRRDHRLRHLGLVVHRFGGSRACHPVDLPLCSCTCVSFKTQTPTCYSAGVAWASPTLGPDSTEEIFNSELLISSSPRALQTKGPLHPRFGGELW